MKKSKIPLPIWVVGLIIVFNSVNLHGIKKEDTNIVTQANRYYKMHNEVVNIVQNSIKKDSESTMNVQKKDENLQIKENTLQSEEDLSSEEQIPDSRKVIEEDEELCKDYAENAEIYQTRMTSYYPAEDTDCTGSGLCSWDFQINDFGAYTYNGKLVVATATEYLLKYGFSLADGVHTYDYYDEITLVIDGVDYQAIVLDSCGSSMTTDRVDLFVSGADYIKDTMIEVKEN